MTPSDIERISACFAEKYDLLITVEEAAAIARVPEGTVRDWSSRGVLDQFKTRRGRRVLFDRDGFVRWLLDGGTGN